MPRPGLALALALAFAPALALAGCLAQEEAPGAVPQDQVTDAATLRPIEEQFTGTAVGTPAAPFSEDFGFEVPRGAVGVNGSLSWSDPLARMDIALLDPDGEIIAEGYPDVNGELVVVTVEPPSPGTWTFRVTSDLAVSVPFTVDAAAELIVPENNVAAKTVELGQASFYEVNLILEEGASFVFGFNSTDAVRWDVHSHPPEGLKEWDAGEGTTGGASFTAPHRDVYSILWENPGALPTELDFQITGKFRLHSHSG